MAAGLTVADWLRARRAERRAFAWGRWDCAIFAGAWVTAATGRPCRWVHADERGAARRVAECGGLVEAVEAGLPAGLTRWPADEAALCGVLVVGAQAACGVAAGPGRWAVLTPRGLAALREGSRVRPRMIWGAA